jgi:aspartate-semialdehyde dehydrogenase
MRVAIIGASGLVGQKLIELLETSSLNHNLDLFAVSQTQKTLPFSFNKTSVVTTPIGSFMLDVRDTSFLPLDIVWVATPNDIATMCVETLIEKKAARIIIDGSSAHRLKPNVPLVIPEICSLDSWIEAKLISSPNCVATIVALALVPLHRVFSVKRIQGSTYQSASGGGRALYEALLNETQSFFSADSGSYTKAFNIYPHESEKKPSGLCGEEEKIIDELRYFLNSQKMPISMRAVRVPSLHAHAIHLTVELAKPFTIETVRQVLSAAPGVRLVEHSASALEASGKSDVLVSDVRLDPSSNNSVELWIVGDQLLKGSSLNMLQIAEISSPIQEKSLT